MFELTPEQAVRFAERGQRVMDRLEALPYPTIALIHGFALGGGLELALACDIRYAASSSKLVLPEVSLGIIPGFGGTQRLLELIGPAKAKELIFTGKRLSAEEALSLGIVQAVVPDEELQQVGQTLAESILKNGPLAVSQAKPSERSRLILNAAVHSACKMSLKPVG